MSVDPVTNRRILVVDDNPAIHDDFARMFSPSDAGDDIDAAAAALFGDTVRPAEDGPAFELAFALQGEAALEQVQVACAEGRPFALAFVDMRMPPGWDGLTTILKCWEVDPHLHVVICTAYTDRSWAEIRAKLTARDQWLVLKKPFDKIEVLQLAQALTDKWNLARQVAGQMARLEEAVEQRTEQLRQSIQVKNEFLANVSHELLTPMNGILGMLDLLADLGLDENQRECLEPARECGARLHQLLQQILAFNQAEAGTLDLAPEPFVAAELAERALDPFRARARHTGVALRADCAPDLARAVHAPVGVLRILLHALLDNAVKFTTRGEVVLTVRTEGSHLVFCVSDTGCGLSPEQLAWLDLPFAQVDGGLNRRNTGIGLGLPLVRRLAHQLGGSFRLQARPEGGTFATVNLMPSAYATGQNRARPTEISHS